MGTVDRLAATARLCGSTARPAHLAGTYDPTSAHRSSQTSLDMAPNEGRPNPNKEENKANYTSLISFPSGAAKPHELDRYVRSLESVLVERDLVDVSKRRFPAGCFAIPWPKSTLVLPDEPTSRATWGDKLAFRKFTDEVHRRKHENKTVRDKRASSPERTRRTRTCFRPT